MQNQIQESEREAHTLRTAVSFKRRRRDLVRADHVDVRDAAEFVAMLAEAGDQLCAVRRTISGDELQLIAKAFRRVSDHIEVVARHVELAGVT